MLFRITCDKTAVMVTTPRALQVLSPQLVSHAHRQVTHPLLWLPSLIYLFLDEIHLWNSSSCQDLDLRFSTLICLPSLWFEKDSRLSHLEMFEYVIIHSALVFVLNVFPQWLLGDGFSAVFF